MDDRDALQFYVEEYHREIERRDATNSGAAVPIAIVSVLIGAAAFILKNWPDPSPRWLLLWLIGTGSAGMIAALCSIIFLIRTLAGYEYEFVPRLHLIEGHRRALRAWHAANPQAEGTAEMEFTLGLIDKVCEAASFNRASNARKSRQLFLTNRSVIAALVFFALSVPPFYFLGGLDQPDKIQLVPLTSAEKPMTDDKPEQILTGNGNNGSGGGPSNSDGGSTADKPQFPGLERIQEGQVNPKPSPKKD